MSAAEDTLTLWRPVGPKELELIQQSSMRAFPPRLPDQPIFYPLLTEDYAIKIARLECSSQRRGLRDAFRN